MKTNPFPKNTDRWAIWDMLVDRDTKAFVASDWDMVADDFIEENFMGIDAGKHQSPDAWTMGFPDLETYKNQWLHQAREFSSTEWAEDLEEAFFRVTNLRDIEIVGDSALVHKKFFGSITKASGEKVQTDWQTLYRCRKVMSTWKIAGFVGYMPHILGDTASTSEKIAIPTGATQHKTAGPYSPVLEINAKSLVVISGQAALDMDGQLIGDTVEEQTIATMENCKSQLEQAGCTLDDVFKVNVYLTDLKDWPRFNEVYKTFFNKPLPVRTAVGTDLLMDLLVEIEMWAAKS
jgi:reactive intermediate/imine deaminase